MEASIPRSCSLLIEASMLTAYAVEFAYLGLKF